MPAKTNVLRLEVWKARLQLLMSLEDEPRAWIMDSEEQFLCVSCKLSLHFILQKVEASHLAPANFFKGLTFWCHLCFLWYGNWGANIQRNLSDYTNYLFFCIFLFCNLFFQLNPKRKFFLEKLIGKKLFNLKFWNSINKNQSETLLIQADLKFY